LLTLPSDPITVSTVPYTAFLKHSTPDFEATAAFSTCIVSGLEGFFLP
jgi:hypothetical protein